MFYLDYAKQVGDRYILNFFADSQDDLKDVPTNKPYITRNGTNYGVPLETSVVTIVEKGVKVNYVLQNGEYIAGGDVAPVVKGLTVDKNGTYNAKDSKVDGFDVVTVNVQPALQEKNVIANGEIVPDEDYYGLSKVTVNVQPKLQEKTITANGVAAPDATYQGFSSVTVNVQPKLQEKNTAVNGVITPDSGFQGLSKVTVDVPATPVEEKTVVLDLAAGDQIVTPTTGKNISKVTITKPAELLPENIKKGITIAGVVGTYEAVAGE